MRAGVIAAISNELWQGGSGHPMGTRPSGLVTEPVSPANSPAPSRPETFFKDSSHTLPLGVPMVAWGSTRSQVAPLHLHKPNPLPLFAVRSQLALRAGQYQRSN